MASDYGQLEGLVTVERLAYAAVVAGDDDSLRISQEVGQLLFRRELDGGIAPMSLIEACAGVHTAIAAVKIGMLGTAPTIDVVEAALEEYRFPTVVLDPVLICKGQEFVSVRAVDDALRSKILPRATMVTPNLFESTTLAGVEEITKIGRAHV